MFFLVHHALCFLLQCFGPTLIWCIAVLIKKYNILKVSNPWQQANRQPSTWLSCDTTWSFAVKIDNLSFVAREEQMNHCYQKGMLCTFGQHSLSLTHKCNLSLVLARLIMFPELGTQTASPKTNLLTNHNSLQFTDGLPVRVCLGLYLFVSTLFSL